MKFLFVFLDSSRVGESFAVFSFVFEVNMEILANILAEKWGPWLPGPSRSYAYDHFSILTTN